MRTRIITLLIGLTLVIFSLQVQNMTKHMRGTFINFVYQDERNKYMNPAEVDETSPELWRLKIKELSAMGIEYVILMFVANDGKSFYPSAFMPYAYPTGRERQIKFF
jgi:uncharacterized lipoprotein YddW (UPF0748 family)